ncbi:SAP domain-containing ribonucleoprotein, partial [Orchesella cincta]
SCFGHLNPISLADLKRELRARNLPITGTKQILVDRLLVAMSAEKSANDDTNIDDLLDEDSMLGEEESDGEADDSVAADLTISSPTAIVPPTSLTSPKKSETLKRPTPSSPLKNDQNGTSAQDDAPPTKKKIILNRQPVPEAAPQILPIATAESVAASKATTENKPPTEGGEKAVIKISEATPAEVTEKLKLREAKFGVAAADNKTPDVKVAGTAEVSEKLKKRAERFGVTAGGGVAASGKVQLTTEDEVKLAKRRERFGVPSDTKKDEQKEKRAARFGINESKPAESKPEGDEKKKLRAARFAAAL